MWFVNASRSPPWAIVSHQLIHSLHHLLLHLLLIHRVASRSTKKKPLCVDLFQPHNGNKQRRERARAARRPSERTNAMPLSCPARGSKASLLYCFPIHPSIPLQKPSGERCSELWLTIGVEGNGAGFGLQHP